MNQCLSVFVKSANLCQQLDENSTRRAISVTTASNMKSHSLLGLLIAVIVVASTRAQFSRNDYRSGFILQNPCVSKQTCSECLQTPTCAWCMKEVSDHTFKHEYWGKDLKLSRLSKPLEAFIAIVKIRQVGVRP